MTFKYLASPYSHPTPAIRKARYEAAREATAWCLRHRIWTYSPIIHCHDLANQSGLPTDAHFWQDYNLAMIDRADELLVLAINGWQESTGVNGEIAYAGGLGLPIRLMTYNTTSHPPTYVFVRGLSGQKISRATDLA